MGPIAQHIMDQIKRGSYDVDPYSDGRRDLCFAYVAERGGIRAGFYYVIQDVKTKKCTITDKKPVATEATVVGPDGVIYKTRTEAETAMKTVKVCTTS